MSSNINEPRFQPTWQRLITIRTASMTKQTLTGMQQIMLLYFLHWPLPFELELTVWLVVTPCENNHNLSSRD